MLHLAVVIIAAAFSAITFSLYNIPLISFIAGIPLYRIIRSRGRRYRAIFIYFFVYYLISYAWLHYFNLMAPLLLAAGYGFVGTVIFRIVLPPNGNKCYRIPFILTLLDLVRSIGPWGFPFIQPAENLIGLDYFLPVLQILGTAGAGLYIYGVSYVLYRGKLPLAAGLLLLPLLAGLIPGGKTMVSKPLGITIIQPNLSGDLTTAKRIQLLDLRGESAVDSKTAVVMLPETVFQTAINDDIRNYIRRLAGRFPSSRIVFGAVRTSGDNSFNSIYWYYQDTYHYYDKRHLVPFGEYRPAFLKPFIPESIYAGWEPFSPGERDTVFMIPDRNVTVIPAVCFESAFSYPFHDHIIAAAENHTIPVLLTVTSDGWSGSRFNHVQHFRSGLLRHLEFGVPWLRCGNSGISGVFIPGREPEHRADDIMKPMEYSFPDTPLVFQPTPYLRWYYPINLAIIVLCCIMLIM